MDVAIIFGSASDKEKMAGAAKCLDEFGLEYKAFIASAHRVPELLETILKEAVDSGAKAIIAGAGLAAHLPGVIASKATIPVIGVPLDAALGGQDALYSIVQMPKGIPVSTVGINNSYNAAMTAVEIIGTSNQQVAAQLKEYRENMKKKFTAEPINF